MPDPFSDCCQAPVILGDICRECREHCEAVDSVETEGEGEDFVGGNDNGTIKKGS